MLPSRPILLLQIKSRLCPCLISQQDSTALSSIQILSKIYVTASSYPTSSHDGQHYLRSAVLQNVKNVGKFVTGVWNLPKEEKNEEERQGNELVLAKLCVVDTVNGPALVVEYCNENDDYCNNNDDKQKDRTIISQQQQQHQHQRQQNKTGSKRNQEIIPLHTIGEVSPYDSFLSSSSSSLSASSLGGICLYGKPKNNSSASQIELCRLELKTQKGNHHHHQENVDYSTTREEVIEALKLLIQWADSKRLAAQYPIDPEQEEEKEDDDAHGGGGIGQRALKIKHFAQREIELSKKKRERENRKARYLKDSGGGLKYTAIAMANRQMS